MTSVGTTEVSACVILCLHLFSSSFFWLLPSSVPLLGKQPCHSCTFDRTASHFPPVGLITVQPKSCFWGWGEERGEGNKTCLCVILLIHYRALHFYCQLLLVLKSPSCPVNPASGNEFKRSPVATIFYSWSQKNRCISQRVEVVQCKDPCTWCTHKVVPRSSLVCSFYMV